jgi:Raf kinase inhibitor-like YbhB/YbcL family protein
MAFTLTSPEFADGGQIPRRFTCDGGDRSPALAWSEAPEGTAGFAVLCDDPDAPRGTFRHWAAWEIPAHWRALAEGYGEEPAQQGVRQAVNDFGRPGYGGPCPPRGHGPHRYVFRLLALSGPIEPPAGARCADVETLAKPLTLAEARLVGGYGR